MAFIGKTILVTGASSGIGRETATFFASRGAELTLSGRNVRKLEQVASECSQLSPNSALTAYVVKADLQSEGEVTSLMESAIGKWGKLDVLVNCAGILEYGSIEKATLEQYDRVMNLNVKSVYQLMNLATPHLIKSRGNIVNVSSVNGLRAFSGLLAYNTSKAALDHLTRCVALELAPHGVRVNCVNPGVIRTNLQLRGGLSQQEYDSFLVRSTKTHALGRIGEPDEVAKAIGFLASDDASFITAVNLPVDGGRHALCPR